MTLPQKLWIFTLVTDQWVVLHGNQYIACQLIILCILYQVIQTAKISLKMTCLSVSI